MKGFHGGCPLMSMWFQASSSRNYLAPTVVVCVGVAFSLVAFDALRNVERQVLAAQFKRAADDRISAVARQLEEVLHGLQFIERFFAGSHKVQRDQFREFIEPYMSHDSGLQALEWIPRVPDAERAAYEKAAKKEFPDFQITEQGAQGRMIPAKRRPEYFPVYYVEPYAGNESALGFDLGSDPTRLEALTWARDTGHICATAPITLVQETADQPGLLVFLPLYSKGAPTDSIQDRRENLESFVLAVFRIGDMVETALDYLEPQGIDVHLYDMSPPVDELLLYTHLSRHRTGPADDGASTDLQASKTLYVAGRTWSVVCTGTPEFIASHSRERETAWLVLTGGLFLTALLASYLLSRQRAEAERQQLHAKVLGHATELETHKERLEAEITQRTAAQDQLRHDARHDSLTGLSNRAVLLDRIERCLQRTKSEPGYVFALLFLDFDRFKIINDSLGHEVGDQLLISIADRLQGNLRVGDTASRVDQEPDPENDNLSVRLGGDEFVILLDGIKNVADATLVAERMQKSLEAPHKIGSHEVTSTASIGIVTSDLGYDSADEILRDADTAMYRAKAAGRARHQVFDRAMHNEAVVRLELESDLRYALQDGQFRLVYQPIIDLRTGLAVGLEALIRWDHPERGVISPMDFIPVAEETGLIVAIGSWVLLEACQQLKQWQEQFPCESPLCMNVNISKRQLTQSDLVKTIQNVLNTTRIEPRTLKLEITETAIMDNLDEFSPVLQRLRACGVLLCIDDFGTGHSSLSCLHEFSIDVLKIDRAFLDNIKETREYVAVTQAIVTLAQNLGMVVVAEGVETPQQVAQLQALEADYAQGYYFAKPLRPEDAAAFLQSQRPFAQSA